MVESVEHMMRASRFGGLVRLALVAVTLLCVGASMARADSWEFDKENSVIRVSWDHLGLSRQQVLFRRMYGTLDFTPTNPTAGQIEVTVPVDGLLTGSTAFDRALKSIDYFDAKTYPYITFKSTGVTQTSTKGGTLSGDLTIRNVTRPVTLAVTWNYTGDHPLAAVNPVYEGRWVSGFSASTVIKRSDFGVGRGAPLVSDEVQIQIEVEFLRRG